LYTNFLKSLMLKRLSLKTNRYKFSIPVMGLLLPRKILFYREIHTLSTKYNILYGQIGLDKGIKISNLAIKDFWHRLHVRTRNWEKENPKSWIGIKATKTIQNTPWISMVPKKLSNRWGLFVVRKSKILWSTFIPAWCLQLYLINTNSSNTKLKFGAKKKHASRQWRFSDY
jgi:hypothetical protein